MLLTNLVLFMAQQQDVGTGSVTFRLSALNREDSIGDGKGNPFLDEDLLVVQPLIMVDYQLAADLHLTADLSFDRVSAASVSRIGGDTGRQSGASGDFYVGLDTGLQYAATDTRTYDYKLSLSSEYDYKSVGLGSGISQEFNQGNTKVSLRLDGYYDIVKMIHFNGFEEDAGETRTSLALTIKAYQMLTPNLHSEFGVTQTQQNGFLSTAYNSVWMREALVGEDELSPGVATDELLPSSRSRTSVYGSLRQAVGDSAAVQLSGRIYSDDWGVGGVSLEPRFYYDFGDGYVARLRYRWYDQSAADYYSRDYFAQLPEFYTQDSDIGEFSSNTIGADFDWRTSDVTSWSTGVDLIQRSDNLDIYMVSFSFTYEF
jgi:hypothetical protein